MPTYQYSCTDCGHFFEAVQSFSDDSLTVCPECEGRLRKVFNAVGVVFKGSGFYRTDSRAQADGVKAGAKAGAKGETSSNGSGSDQGLDAKGSGDARRRRPRRPRRPPPRPDPGFHRSLTPPAPGLEALWIADARPARIGLPSGAMNSPHPRPGPLGRPLRVLRRLRRRVLLHRRLLAATGRRRRRPRRPAGRGSAAAPRR